MKLQTILVPLDFSDVSARVVEHARSMAQGFGGRVVLLHIAEPEPDFAGYEIGIEPARVDYVRDFQAEHHRLEVYKRELAAAGLEVEAAHAQGPLAGKVLEEAERLHADLIVMGSHGHGALYQLLVGSVTAGVVKGAKCPVLIVPAAPAT